MARSRSLHLALLCAVLPILGCGSDDVATASAAPKPPPVAVQVLTLTPSPLRETVEYLGALTSRASVDISPQVSGYVRAIRVHAGDHVEAGAPLVDIDAREASTAVASANAQALAARARSTQADRALARLESLHHAGIAAAEDIERAQTDVALAQAATREAEADAAQRRIQLRFFVVVAPSAGIVGDIPIRVGDAVTAGQPLTTLTGATQVELSVSVPIERARTIRTNETMVEVLGPDGAVQLRGPIYFLAPRADPRTQLVETKVRLDNTVGLREGELVQARVVYSERDALLAPPLAVVRQSGQPYLFVLSEANHVLSVAKRPVTLALLRPEGYELLSGVTAGERIAVSSLQSLRDGTSVTIAAPAAAPAAVPAAPQGSTP